MAADSITVKEAGSITRTVVVRKMGMFQVMQQLVGQNGWASLWRGVGPSLWRDVPFSALYWLGAEEIRRRLTVRPPRLTRSTSPALHRRGTGWRRRCGAGAGWDALREPGERDAGGGRRVGRVAPLRRRQDAPHGLRAAAPADRRRARRRRGGGGCSAGAGYGGGGGRGRAVEGPGEGREGRRKGGCGRCDKRGVRKGGMGCVTTGGKQWGHGGGSGGSA